MTDIKKTIQDNLINSINSLYPQFTDVVNSDFVEVEVPQEFSFGDYTSSVSLKLGKIVKQSPLKVAQSLVNNLKSDGKLLENIGVSKVEIKNPGFINFFVSNEHIITQVNSLLENPSDFGKHTIDVKTLEKFLKRQSKEIKLDHLQVKDEGKVRVMFEFGHPNTHKEMHIGHLRNVIIGESLIRLLANLGVEVIRVNYEGDVGMHIAKCLWGLKNSSDFNLNQVKSKSTIEKVEVLAKAYVAGNKAYEENPASKEEILNINRKIYAKDPDIISLWKETRQWSLDYFESIYNRVDTHFDRYYFESEVFESGKKIVLENVGKVFQKSQGAVIFPGEKYGLHNRVFITAEGNATYEGKEMGLGKLQFDEYNPAVIVHNVASEQSEYFKVVFKALGLIFPDTKGREFHHVYGWVTLKEGKMSSRKGNVVSARWLLDEAQKYSKTLITKENYTEKEKEDIAKKVAVGAVKYSFLRFSSKSDISFSFKDSVSLEGDCGPYIMYTYSRTQSVLKKAGEYKIKKLESISNLNPDEILIIRLIYKYLDIVYSSAVNFSPNTLTKYLYDLSGAYNLFYNKHQIINAKENKEFRIALNKAVGEVIKKGLYLLGIDTVSRM